MRLLIDGTAIEPNPKGVGRYSWEVSKRLALGNPHQWEIDLLIFKGNARGISGNFLGNIIEVPKVSELRRGLLEIPRLVRSRRPSVLLRMMESAGRRYRVPTITVCHDIADLIRVAGREPFAPMQYVKSIVMDQLRMAALRSSSKVLTVSSFLKAQLVNAYSLPEDKIDVAYCGVDSVFAEADPVHARSYWEDRIGFRDYVLAFATGDPRENGKLLPGVLSALRAHGCGAPLVVAGVGLDSEFAKELKSSFVRAGLAVGKDYQLLGFLGANQRGELANLYAAAAVYLELSGHEGFGMQLAEAMVAGAICVSSGRGALREVGAEFAFEFDGLEPSSVAQRVIDALQASDKATRRERQAHFASRYSWDTATNIIRGAVQELM